MNDPHHQFADDYNRHIDEIYRYIFFAVRQHQETAEDLASTTFMKAWSKIDQFDPEKSSMRTYLYRIARNTVIDYYKKKKSSSLEAEQEIPIKSKEAENADAALFWKQAKSELDDSAFEMLVLKYRNELSLQEIAEITEKTVDAVKSSLKRSRQKLQQVYDSE